MRVTTAEGSMLNEAARYRQERSKYMNILCGIYTCVRVCIHMCMHLIIYMYMCAYACLHVCVCVRVYACAEVCEVTVRQALWGHDYQYHFKDKVARLRNPPPFLKINLIISTSFFCSACCVLTC